MRNATGTALLSAFARRVARDPAAVVVASPQRHLRAGDLADRAALWADRWPTVTPGSIVGLRAPNGSEFLAGLLALERLGAVPALLDPGLPDSECRRTLATLGAVAWVASAEAWPRPGREPAWETLGGGADPEGTAVGDALAPDPSAGASPGGLIKLTSGTTGTPRGIEVPEDALLADEQNLWRGMALEGSRTFLATIPLSHSYGLASLALPALLRDVTLVLAETRGPFEALRAGRALGAEFFPTVPAWLAAWSRLADPPPLPESLRLLVSAGAPLAPETAERVHRRSGRRVHAFYGSSESGGIAFDREGGAAERGSVGRPLEGVAVAIDPADGRIVVGSPAVGRRYLPLADPALEGGVFRTGDLGRIDAAGELHLLGRVDDMVLVKGKNVSPREVEEVLCALPGVDEAAVLGVRFAPHAEPVLRAAIGGAGAMRLSHQEIVEHCRRILPEHKVPRSILVFERLPRTERGKLDRDALREEAPGGSRRPR